MGGHGHGPGWHGNWQGGWSNWSDLNSRGRGGPPPWLAGIFGLVPQDRPQRPRAKRGDVRAAILDVLAVEPLNGYQVIQQIAERSGGQWKPSPGSVYPTVSQLEDEGLVTADEERGRTLRLTPEGEAYVAEHPDELSAVWAAFEDEPAEEEGPDLSVLKSEIGQLMSAAWQILSSGTDQQRKDAMAVLIETRRKLYGLLADEEPQTRSDQ
ncbi:MAG TPA: PadR family transcriptional regulator [Nocardioidaceae bacterium]|nr:PadR family transcriptional regulator [Nocardioidaceae bacterium]